MISQLPFRALVTLSSGQPPDSKTCHSSARSYSNCSICFKAISIFIYICQARALLHLASETNKCPNRQPPGARAKCGTKSRNSTAILFLERFLSHAPHLSSRIIVFPNPDLISQHFRVQKYFNIVAVLVRQTSPFEAKSE